MPGPWHTLVSAKALKAHLDDPDLVLLDCRHALGDPEDGPRAYEDGHLPGARHAHIDRDLSGPLTGRNGRHPLPEPDAFRRTAGHLGIHPGAQVVAYDAHGGAWAARAWWLLRHYGHDTVAVLDGGLPAWTRIGGPLTRDVPPPSDATFLGNPGHLPTVDADSLRQRVPVPAGTLLDARDPERYRGDQEPIDPVAGHIPGARNAPYKDSLDATGRFQAPDELRARFDRLIGTHAPDEVAVYCGSGVTAAHLLLALEVAGLPGAALYPGSWSEWCADRDRPVETGPAATATR